MHVGLIHNSFPLVGLLWDFVSHYATVLSSVGSLPGSSVHGILQPRILEWVAISSSRDLPDPGIEPGSSAFV